MTLAATPEALAEALSEFQRRNGYHRPEIEELLMEFGELLLTKVVSALQQVTTENDRLRERLEIAHAFDGTGNRVPFPAGMEHLDGIACRDETIRVVEEQREQYRQKMKDALAAEATAAAEAASLRAEVEALKEERDGAEAKVAAYREAIRVAAEAHRAVEVAEQRENERLRRHPIIRGTALARAATAGEGRGDG